MLGEVTPVRQSGFTSKRHLQGLLITGMPSANTLMHILANAEGSTAVSWLLHNLNFNLNRV